MMNTLFQLKEKLSNQLSLKENITFLFIQLL